MSESIPNDLSLIVSLNGFLAVPYVKSINLIQPVCLCLSAVE